MESSEVTSNINVTGLKQLDVFCVFVYPWIMCLLFVVSGVSARYSLNKKTNKEFVKDRTKRILIPSIVGIFAYGWISGWMTNYYTDIFAGNGDMIPTPIKYIIWSLIGIGPLWYAHVLYIASLLIVLIRKIDKKQKLDTLFNKINLPILFLLGFAVWGSSFILNMPLITVYRFGIFKKYLNFNNNFTNYMNKNNFNFYVLHYTIELIIAFILVKYIKLNYFILNYIILLLGTIIVLPIITEIIKKIPIANKLLLGISKNK